MLRYCDLLPMLNGMDYFQLLDHDTKASDQVPLLLTMKEDRLALEKAVDSGDTDLGNSYLSHRPVDVD